MSEAIKMKNWKSDIITRLLVLRMPENTFPRILIINVSGGVCTMEPPTRDCLRLSVSRTPFYKIPYPLQQRIHHPMYICWHASRDIFYHQREVSLSKQRRLKANQTYNKWQKWWDTSQRNSIFENLENITLARGRSPILTRACAVLL